MDIKKLLSASVLVLVALTAQAQSLAEAIKFSETEQYDKADHAFEKLISEDPANGDAYYFFGKNFISTEDVDSAEIMFRKGVEKAPTNPLNYIGLGAVGMFRGKKSEAQPYIDKGVNLSENKSIPVLIEAAYALIEYPLKDTMQAKNFLFRARELDLGKDKKPKNSKLYVALGDMFLEGNQGGLAMNNYEKALTIDKSNVRAYLRQGQLWVRARNFDSALKSYNEAIKLDSTFAPAYREKGDFFYLFDKYGLAKEQYKKYLTLAKNNFKARVRYSKFLFLAKQYPDAIIEIDAILKADSSLIVLKRLKAFSLYETRKYEEGLKMMNKFMSQQPADMLIPQDYEYLGKLLLKNNQDSLALKTLLDVYTKDTSKKEIAGFIGEAYRNMKKYPEAITYFEIKTKMAKGVATVDWLNLGSAYFQNRNWLKADTAFQNAIKIQPDYARSYLFRARCLAKMDTLDVKTFAGKAMYETFLLKLEEKDKTTESYKPLISEAYKYLGIYYYTNKNFPFALFCFNKALANKADDKDIPPLLKAKEFDGVTEAEPPMAP